MSSDLLAALCLVLVIEGLFLLVAPDGWKRMAEHVQAMPSRVIRWTGGTCAIVGVLLLQLVRG